MKLMNVLCATAAMSMLTTLSPAQTGGSAMPGMQMGQPGAKKPLLSPAATASLTLQGATITVNYNAPSLRGRHLGGPEIVPYGKVWRTGANPATTLVTPISLHFGSLLVPAGTYTLYTLPMEKKWMLIVNKQTGQWGTEYHEEQDLGRVEMTAKKLPSSQEVMSISFDDIKKDSAMMHIRWETTDESVKVSTP